MLTKDINILIWQEKLHVIVGCFLEVNDGLHSSGSFDRAVTGETPDCH